MTFFWPYILLFLMVVPLLIAAYIWLQRRRRKYVVRYSNLDLIRAALPPGARWRRHLPFVFFLLAVSSLIIGAARPAAEVEVPLSRTTIILALDVSRSMCATDVSPNRLSVAQEAALAFVDEQVEGTQIGVVAFAGLAEIIVPPTKDKDVLRQAITNLTTSFGTAIGSATLKSIDAIAEINPDVPPSGVNLDGETVEGLLEGEYMPDIIVLLTDGANSQGPLPSSAAQQAVDRGVRVYTIGFGTEEIVEMVCSRAQLGSDIYGPGGIGGGGFGFDFDRSAARRYLVINEPALREVAEMTGGTYYRAENADQLQEIFLNLPTQIVLQTERLEISVFFTALGGVLAAVALILSILWKRYP